MNKVEQFYDNFSTKCLKYFVYINPRLEAVKTLCRKFVKADSKVLEVGCGVGVVSRYLSELSPCVAGLDISKRSIDIARAYTNNPRLYGTDILSWSSGGACFDVILLADVIEHIGRLDYDRLFEKLRNMLTADGLILLTFPSPAYSAYFKRISPEKAQIVEETVDLDYLLGLPGLSPVYLSYQHLDGQNQYIHLVLAENINYTPFVGKPNIIKRIGRLPRKMWWRVRNYFFLRKIS